jgi:hypothetical protein
MKKVPAPKVATSAQAPESPLPAQIQEALGELVGARRPSITSALSKLQDVGHLTGTADGCWVLRGDPALLSSGCQLADIASRSARDASVWRIRVRVPGANCLSFRFKFFPTSSPGGSEASSTTL